MKIFVVGPAGECAAHSRHRCWGIAIDELCKDSLGMRVLCESLGAVELEGSHLGEGPPSVDVSMTSVHPAGFGALERERIAILHAQGELT
jgi:hypothetical protein